MDVECLININIHHGVQNVKIKAHEKEEYEEHDYVIGGLDDFQPIVNMERPYRYGGSKYKGQ